MPERRAQRPGVPTDVPPNLSTRRLRPPTSPPRGCRRSRALSGSARRARSWPRPRSGTRRGRAARRASRAGRPAAPPRAPPARRADTGRRCRSRRRGPGRRTVARASRHPPRPRPTSWVSIAFVSVDVGGSRRSARRGRVRGGRSQPSTAKPPSAASLAREAGLEARPAPVRAHRDLPGDGEPRLGPVSVGVAAAAPARVGVDRLPLRLGEGDAPGRVARGDGDRRDGVDALGKEQRPLEHLHPAERAADDEPQAPDAERVEQGGLDAHDVADGDGGEVRAPASGAAGTRGGRARWCRSSCRARCCRRRSRGRGRGRAPGRGARPTSGRRPPSP